MTDPQAAIELLPCPFCGSNEVYLNSGVSRYIECSGCCAEGPWNDESDEQAITAWNTRTLARSAVEQTEEVRDVVGYLTHFASALEAEAAQPSASYVRKAIALLSGERQ